MKFILLISLLPILFCLSVDAKTINDATIPPEDSADAENLKIWVPIEKNTACRVMIDILDKDGRIVRQLVNKLLGKGYHNFYWDKRNDDGLLVEPGEYYFRADGCHANRTGKVKVEYKKWERKCGMGQFEKDEEDIIFIDLKGDSALVSIDIHTFDGRLIDKPLIDSVMNTGIYQFRWQPENSVLPGRYKATVMVEDYHKTFIIKHNK